MAPLTIADLKRMRAAVFKKLAALMYLATDAHVEAGVIEDELRPHSPARRRRLARQVEAARREYEDCVRRAQPLYEEFMRLDAELALSGVDRWWTPDRSRCQTDRLQYVLHACEGYLDIEEPSRKAA